MTPIFRIMLAVVLGVALAIGIVAAIDTLNNLLYPLAIDIEVADRASLAGVVAAMPFAAKLLVVLPWFVAPACGAWLALRICDTRWSGWIVTLVVLAAAVATVAALPHPLWMQACAGVLPLLGGWVAQRLHRKPYPGEPLLG